MVEIGGTVGDIESLPFLEAIRQMGVELGRDRALYIHLTLVPFMAASSEIKTKPTQHSVKELRAIGIQPDVLVCRSEHALPREQRAKIALFTNVEERAVISAVDVDDIYKIPMLLARAGPRQLSSSTSSSSTRGRRTFREWQAVVDAKAHPEAEVTIAMVGKYVDLRDSYMSLTEALRHAGIRTRTRVNILYMESEDIQTRGTSCLNDVDAILVPGGFGERGIEGKIAAVKFAREKKVPYLGICLGLQVAVIEYARNVAGLARRAFDGAEPADAASRHRDDHRVAGSRRLAPRSAARRPISAARCGSARRRASSRTARSRRRSTAPTRSPSATAIATSSTTAISSSSRKRASCSRASRATGSSS